MSFLSGRIPHCRDCRQCGSSFVAPNVQQLYCSAKCCKRANYLRHPRPMAQAHCKNCKAIFRQHRTNQIYCTVRCRYRALDRRKRKKLAPIIHKTVACACGCGIAFRRDFREHKYATKACHARQHRRDQYSKIKAANLTKKSCKNCGNPFFTTRPIAKLHCTRKCAIQFANKLDRERYAADKLSAGGDCGGPERVAAAGVEP